jgi:hypothetical protein
MRCREQKVAVESWAASISETAQTLFYRGLETIRKMLSGKKAVLLSVGAAEIEASC